MLSLARACLIVCIPAFAGCSASDLVARRPDRACEEAGNDCGDGNSDAGTNGCRAESCNALASHALLCQAGQVQVLAGDSCDANGSAQGSRYALCSCTDLVSSTTLQVDAFAGTLNQSPSRTAQLGINGNLSLKGQGTIDADLVVRGRIDIGDDVMTNAPMPNSSAPCDCAIDAFLDIAGLVSAHASDNDNALAGISSEQLNGFSAREQLTLDCGRYYFTRLKGDAPVSIRTRGHVAIFVASNVELGDALSIQTESDSQVSLFVAGDMHVGGSLSLGGDPNGKARADLYLASEGTLEIAGSTEISGKLYAPRAELVSVGPFQIYGSLFVRRAAPGGELRIHYDELGANGASCALP